MKLTSQYTLGMIVVSGLVSASPAPAPLEPVPTPQQVAWQRMEMTMFLHFGINTFTDREWGDGREDPKLFHPTALDARQWVRTAKEAGFKLMILTAKHHDGFCLWPSAYTEHSVKHSSWQNGQGDVVREFIDACRAEGMKTGIYLSPWDRNHPGYGDSPRYNAHFTNQLAEICRNYGPIDEFWFDGACGEGPNGKQQVYDWKSYYDTLYHWNPQMVVAICGPDIRWVGNESGVARPGESSVQSRDGQPVWYPAECDVSIRPGWFYHSAQDGSVKSVDHLLDIYFKSVGRNSVLLLNVPPDRRGLLADADVTRLREFRAALDDIFARDYAAGRPVRAGAERGSEYAAARAVDGNLDTYWATPDAVADSWLEIELGEPRLVNLVGVQEFIPLGERIQEYRMEARVSDTWKTVAKGTVIGHKNLLNFAAVEADAIRLVIEKARACPAVAEVSVFYNPHSQQIGSGSLAAHRPAEASNVHPGGTVWGGDKAVDDDPSTRWATSDETRECWLEVDLGQVQLLGSLRITELQPRIAKFALEVRNDPGQPWRVACNGDQAGTDFKTAFDPVRGRYVRLHILEATFAPTIWEFQVFAPEPNRAVKTENAP